MMRYINFILGLLLCTALFSQSAGYFDPSFAVGGKVVRDLYGYTDGINDVEVLADDKILAAGFGFDGNLNQLSLSRYYSNGTLDASFNASGIEALLPTGWDAVAEDIFLCLDGNILLSGYISNGVGGHIWLVRLNAQGLVDGSFGTNGIVFLGEPAITYSQSRISCLPAGDIVLAATADDGTEQGIVLWSLMPDGNSNRLFGTDGIQSQWISGDALSLANVHYISSNAVLVSGTRQTLSGTSGFVVSYNASGSLNASFGQNGWFTYSGSSNAWFEDSYFQNGTLLISGSESVGANRDVLVLKVDMDGQLMPSFGMGGVVNIAAGAGYASAMALRTAADGKILLGGIAFNGFTNELMVAVLNADGQMDYAFGNNGLSLISLFNGQHNLRSLSIRQDGRILLGGNVFNGNDYDMVLLSLMGPALATGIDAYTMESGIQMQVSPGMLSMILNASGTLLLSDMGGRVVYYDNVNAGSLQLQVPSTGIYMLEFNNGTTRNSAKIMIP